MAYLKQIPKNSLSVERGPIPVIYVPPCEKIIARAELGSVVLIIDTRRVEMTTIVAHKIGLGIARMIPDLAPNELVNLTINGERLALLADVAKRVSTALLRKADDADDWQLKNNRRAAS